DGRPVPNDKLRQQFSVDPGRHVVHAEDGYGAVFEQDYTLREGESLTIEIKLKAPETDIDAYTRRCMLRARTWEEVKRCKEGTSRSPLVIKAGTGISAYTDSLHVNVLTPEINASIAAPTAGWNVGGAFLVDVVSAASPDIVSEASKPFKEKRYVGTLT